MTVPVLDVKADETADKAAFRAGLRVIAKRAAILLFVMFSTFSIAKAWVRPYFATQPPEMSLGLLHDVSCPVVEPIKPTKPKQSKPKPKSKDSTRAARRRAAKE